jgi:DNA-binding HxlR family transcriptional regulator
VAKRSYSCGIGPAFEVIGGKWKAAILWELHEGALRFGELKRRVSGISEKMLIQHLRDMERDKLVSREVFHQVPPRVEYTLTQWGMDLNDALAATADWGERYARAWGKYPK